MVDKACTKGGKGGTHVRPLQALNLVHDGCERVSAKMLSCLDSCSVTLSAQRRHSRPAVIFSFYNLYQH